jgi:hypothetical protein
MRLQMPNTVQSAAQSARFHMAVCVVALIVSTAVPADGRGQTITPRTIPVLMSHQFDILPSDRSGMAGVSIALDDTLLDPFANPAKATRNRNGLLSIAPFFHSMSESRGGGRTLPISGFGSFGDWAVGGLMALQQLDRAQLSWNAPISERTASNRYLSGILARRLGNGVSIGEGGCGRLWETACCAVFQAAVDAFCASMAASASIARGRLGSRSALWVAQ